MNSFEKDLLSASFKELRLDPLARHSYSVDASIFEVYPKAILLPQSTEEIQKALKIAKKHHVPVSPRGAATGITGGCLSDGLILDLSKHFTKILEINPNEKWARVQSGVILDHLNEACLKYNLMLGAETSTSNRATLGGMLANNAAGARSLRFGKMSDHILEVTMLLSNGDCVVINQEDKRFLPTLERIKETYKQEIIKHFPNIPRRVSGYNLDALLENPINPCKLIAGSEGTLGIVKEMKLALVEKPKQVVVALLFFNNMLEGMRQLPDLLKLNPIAIEMIDRKILEMAKQSPVAKEKLSWVKGSPEAVFVIEIEKEKAGYFNTVLTDAKSIQEVWDVRKAGLGLLLSKRSYSKAIAFIEDLSVAPKNLAPFMEKFLTYLKSIGKEAGIYGHVGSGCMHLRPYIDLRKQEELTTVEKIMLDTADLVKEAGGALSGEHGDGLLRTWLNEKMFGQKLTQAFQEIKHLFDPENLLNPGKVVDGKKPWEHLRNGPETPEVNINTFFTFDNPGGLSFAANMCNGNGQCRKMEGTMCPSFQATGDEYQTTRARAQALRAIATGRVGKEMIQNDELLDILDLCIECKGCKKECPSEVDMARMKAEMLFQRDKHTLRDYLFGHLGDLFAKGQAIAPLINWLNQTTLAKGFLSLIGITKKLSLPQLAKERFSTWVLKQTQKQGEKVLLFNDTYTEFLCPEIGIAAFKLLNQLGFFVIVPPWQCCGRTLISKGYLKEAVQKGKKLIDELSIYENLPLIVLEPSCFSALIDEYGALPKLQKFSNTYLLEDFLLQHKITFTPSNQSVLLHGHCHQKALVGLSSTLKLLQKIPGLNVKEIPSGCCGMAGSFGYEKEHQEISEKIASLKLIPDINASSHKKIIANGLSCRSQIQALTHQKALHIAEFLLDVIPIPE